MNISDKLQKAREYEKTNYERTLKEKPLFHAAAPIGWINDPNGFSAFREKYHLFFQYHPYGTEWGPMHWGHYTTRDFISWKLEPCALAPDMEYDRDGCFSGTAVAYNGRHIIMYTGVKEQRKSDGTVDVRQTQCIAVGNGTEYTKYENNPVITADILPKGSSAVDFRDPKIWRDEKGFWSLIGSKNEDGSGQLALFFSENSFEWKFLKMVDYCKNEYGKMWECPDFFELDEKHVLIVSPQFMHADGEEFHCGNNSIYFVGNYDAERLEWHRDVPHIIDHGLDFYAAQTVETFDGRRIMIAWMQSWDNHILPDEYNWSGIMTVPRELSIVDGKLIQRPVRELENYRSNKKEIESVHIDGAKEYTELDGINGRCIDLNLKIKEYNCSHFSVLVAADQKHQTEIRFDMRDKTVTTDRSRAGFKKDYICSRAMKITENDHRISARILVDKYSIEVFMNDGEAVMSTLIYTPEDADRIYFQTDGDVEFDVEKYEIQKGIEN